MFSISTYNYWSTVTVEMEHGGPWIYVTVVGHGSEEHDGRSYKIRVTKMGLSSHVFNDTWITPSSEQITYMMSSRRRMHLSRPPQCHYKSL